MIRGHWRYQHCGQDEWIPRQPVGGARVHAVADTDQISGWGWAHRYDGGAVAVAMRGRDGPTVKICRNMSSMLCCAVVSKPNYS